MRDRIFFRFLMRGVAGDMRQGGASLIRTSSPPSRRIAPPPLFILCGGLLVFPLALIGCPSPPLYLSERSGRRSEQGRRPPSSAPHRGGAGD